MPPKIRSPSSDQIAIDRERHRHQEAVAHVAHHRLHRHAGVAAVTVRLVGAHGGCVVVRGSERFLGRERIAELAWDRAPCAVVAEALDGVAELLD